MMNTSDLINNALESISNILNYYHSSTDKSQNKKASLLSYWLIDYMKMLKREETFDSTKLKRYKRGEIVKVHLGYNIGSEQGGLHYAIVLDKNNSPSSNTVTIVPLSSVKDNKVLHNSKVMLGDTIYFQLNEKLSQQETLVNEKRKSTQEEMLSLQNIADTETDEELLDHKLEIIARIETLRDDIQKLNQLRDNNIKIRKEIHKMKKGSVALVDQITTISKIRIYNPLHPNDTLSNIRISPALLDLIDAKITELYLGK